MAVLVDHHPSSCQKSNEFYSGEPSGSPNPLLPLDHFLNKIDDGTYTAYGNYEENDRGW